VKAHFEGLYNLREPDWTHPGSCLSCYCNRKAAGQRRRQYVDAGTPPDHPTLPLNTAQDAAKMKSTGPTAHAAASRMELHLTCQPKYAPAPDAVAPEFRNNVAIRNQRKLIDNDVYPVYRECPDL